MTDYHLQTNVDLRALAVIAKAQISSGIAPRSLAAIARQVIEQYAMELISGGAEEVEYSEDAREFLESCELLRPSGTRLSNFNSHLRKASEQTGTSMPERVYKASLETAKKTNLVRDDLRSQAEKIARRLTKNQATELRDELQKKSLYLDESLEETQREKELRREREEREMLELLRSDAKAPLEKGESIE